jgi:hypothetical protein
MEFDAWYANVAVHHANRIKHQTYVNKRNAPAISQIPRETLKACLLPKETCYFIWDHGRTKAVKKEATSVPISEGLPFGEASEPNEVATKKRRVTKNLQLRSISLQKLLEPFF